MEWTAPSHDDFMIGQYGFIKASRRRRVCKKAGEVMEAELR
jgi:hypothetical protein